MHISSANSFSALGFSNDEAVVDALRADLADIVRGYMVRSQLSQMALAKKMGIPQSTVSAIKNDNIDKLSVEYFIRILTRLDLPWTARSWLAPHDAAVVQGFVPASWVTAEVTKPRTGVYNVKWGDSAKISNYVGSGASGSAPTFRMYSPNSATKSATGG